MKIKLPRRYHRVGVAIRPPRHPVGGEFDRYQKKNYQFEPVNCLCGVKNSDYVISTVDREGWKYKLVACQSCGLIRASDYWDEYSLADFYSNWYRESGESDVNSFYARQANRSASVKNFVEQHTSDFKKRYVVFDIGGGAGGILDSFRNDARCYLVDYDISFFKKAESMGISTQRGGINDLENIIDQPDLVILSHVLEHFTDVNQKIEDLTSRLRIGALVYIELPGIDSLCEGRRKHDFLGDIHIPHVFYFSQNVLNNVMRRLGFECVHSTSEIRALFRYTGIKGERVNHHDSVCSLIRRSETKRKFHIYTFKRILSLALPEPLKNFIKKFG